MVPVILKDLHVRGRVAAGALLLAAACGGDEAGEKATSAAPARGDSAAAPTTAAVPAPNAAQPQAAAPATQPGAAVMMDSAMTPAQAVQSAPEPQGPVNVQTINQYQLTMPRLRQLVQGGKNLAALQARRPELRDSMRIATMDPNALYERLNAIPAAREAVNQAGISPREYALATAALLQAAMVHEMRRAGQQPPAAVNEGNVRFVSENWEEIQSMMRAAGPRPQQPQAPRQP
jgi:hypothetical protein